MKYISALMTKASGSIRGITASRNRGGTYFRGRTSPVNPATAAQQVVRNALTSLVGFWTTVLTSTQRTNWKTYADNTPSTDSLGNSVVLTGQNMYIRSNTPRIQASLPTIANAPTTYDLGSFTMPTLTLTAGAGTATLAYAGADAWATEGTTSAMLVYTSPPQNPSINFYKGPYKYAGKITGTAGSATLTLPVSAGASGSKTFFQVTVTRSDGRLSSPLRGSAAP